MKLKLSLFLLVAVSVFAQTPHQVALTWVQSTTPGITANNVYRGTGACSGNPTLNLLTTTPLAPTTTYTDTAVVSGTTYCYAVTASVGVEMSADSNTAGAIVPSTTLAPTGLTVTAQ